MGMFNDNNHRVIETQLSVEDAKLLIRRAVEGSVTSMNARVGGQRFEWSPLTVQDGGVFGGPELGAVWGAEAKLVAKKAPDGAYVLEIRVFDDGSRRIDIALGPRASFTKGYAAKSIERTVEAILDMDSTARLLQ
jgi:hypothetical protein